MKKMSKVSLIALATMMSSVAFAADSQWEIWTGGLGSLDFTTQNSVSSTTIHLMGRSSISALAQSVGYNIGNGLQVKVSPSFSSYSSGGTTSSSFQILAGLNYSFMGAMDDSMFVEAQAGINSMTTTTTTSNFMWMAGLGKRFKIVDHVTFAPEVTFSMLSQAAPLTATTVFSIVPVQFTLQL